MRTTKETPVFPRDGTPVYTNWARTAIRKIIELEGLRGGTVGLPAFICQDSFQPIFDSYDLTPRFVDIDSSTYHMDLTEAEPVIADADAVIFVHTFGLPADLEPWRDICDEYDTVLVEDCARALGAQVNGRVVGGTGDYGVYSLAKVMPVAKGGVLYTTTPDEVSLEAPAYDTAAVYHLLPDRIRERLSVDYPLDVESRRLDTITRLAIRQYVLENGDTARRETRTKAQRLREGLEGLGLEVQPDSKGRVYQTLPTCPPCDRDELSQYLRAHHVPHKCIWANPWAKTHSGSAFAETYPQTSTVSDRILHYKIREMDDDGIRDAIACTRTFVEEFA